MRNWWSGRRIAVVAAAALIVGCGGGAHSEPASTPSSTSAPSTTAAAGSPTVPATLHPPEPTLQPTPTSAPPDQQARPGAPFSVDDATARLKVHTGDRLYSPVAAYGQQLIVRSADARIAEFGHADDPPDYRLDLWDPRSGSMTPLWATPARQEPVHDIVSGVDAPWAATVRTGMSLPFDTWELILRNLETGEERSIAASDPAVVETPGLEPKLPAGFAPLPSIAGGKVTWDAIEITDSGTPVDRVFVYDIASGTQETILENDDVATREVYSPSIGGDRVAWVEHPAPDAPYVIVIHDLGSGQERRIENVGGPYSASLSADGRYLAWDDGMFAKWAEDLVTGERTMYFEGPASGTYVSGGRVGWAIYANQSGVGGFYDFASRTVRKLVRTPGTNVVYAMPLGDWFVWQEGELTGDRYGVDGRTYYALPLD